MPAYVAVCGPGAADGAEEQAAEEVGRLLAGAGAILLTGGLGGVMAAAAHGARTAGGITVALLPGERRAAANPDSLIVLPTGLGELRNALLVRCADAVVAVGGAYGTLSEVALALKIGRPVVGLNTWALDDVLRAETPAAAVEQVLALLELDGRGGT